MDTTAQSTIETKSSAPRVSPSPKEESFRASGRKALITTVIAITLNPISLIVGYLINHSLQAPRLSIQYVTPIYTLSPKRLGVRGLRTLEKNPRMASALRSTIAQRSPGGDNSETLCTLWLDGQDWDNSCGGIVSDSISGMRQELKLEIKALTRNIQLVQGWIPPKELVLEPVRTPDAELTRLMQATQGGQFNRPQAIAQFRFYLDQDRGILRGLESLAKDFQQMLELPDVRTTDLGFKIGVLNSGDSDGVIFDSGAVKFGATELPINSDQFTVVKAHSFETIEFSAFYGQLDTERQKLQDIVKNGASDDVPFKISVRIGDKSVETVGALPKKEQ